MEPTIIQDVFATKKKPIYRVRKHLRGYLNEYGREVQLPVTYEELRDFSISSPLFDSNGEDTLWETVAYPQGEMQRIAKALTQIYVLLKTNDSADTVDHLYMDRIDFCTFGNSQPFRIRIVNAHNDNQDYYYVKKADASRVYGLELEHLLSPNRMHYLTSGNTLIEEHVVGIPGDQFITKWMKNPELSRIRLAKELVKFNERCFVRLLGDMRSYNFVVDLTPDFEGLQVRIRAMDFDQQSYSGKKSFYFPQFFKSNNPLVFFCTQELIPSTAEQYQVEERALIVRRIKASHLRLRKLLAEMRQDEISAEEKVTQLKESLAEHYQSDRFLEAHTMGDLVTESLSNLISGVQRDRKKISQLDLYH